ncbi:DNA/RNA non-specific endonuclease [Autumnicola psychrophila]|uniref:DNA/RNA non-specific endonuclease n=1 Tax=Autumnicola psychrophila TaxID=3075592 RepID=A0ABU3DQC8_9FLAO|nr:DNA/RNA non-specific endonuclease [Zunongwangia sp. F225]MDT0685911.1 DNA/RNA non-specific endonuclease [Zunongwangia sp. F225]
MKGYDVHFLGENFVIGMPNYEEYSNDIALNKKTTKDELDYIHYSVIQSKSRRVPIVSASNIYRIKYEKVGRVGSFKKDDRISSNEQLTTTDYKQFNTIKAATIEKGHMTKREDVQWDLDGDEDDAQKAAISTFFYPNAAPQHDSLNNGPWKHLENSIIIKGRVPEPAKVSVFTGPVLDKLDPEFKVRLKDGSIFKIPILFWKVIYYLKVDGKLYRAGFLMGQINPLRKDDLINEIGFRDFELVEKKTSLKPFLDFKEDENYQVSVSLIEELTKLKFQNAIDRHENIKPTILKLEEVQIRSFEDSLINQEPSFEVTGLLV